MKSYQTVLTVVALLMMISAGPVRAASLDDLVQEAVATNPERRHSDRAA